MVNFPLKIKEKRLSLGESQAEFAARFSKSSTAVSLWEAGKRQAPYEVLQFLFNGDTIKVISCPACGGKGSLTIN